MANSKVDHYEALFNSKYLRWFDLNGEPALVKIVKVEADISMTLPGGAKDKRPVLHIESVNSKIETDKPMVLNKTNGNSIAEIHGKKPSGWIGKEIVLFKDVTSLRGKPTECIRIRARRPANG